MRDALDGDAERHYVFSVESLDDALRAHYGGRDVSLQQLAGTFRSGDFLEMLNDNGPALA